MQECVDYLVPQFRAESNGFWDPEIDKELAITVSHGGGSFCSETAGARSYLNDANDGEMMKMNKQGWSAALAVYRLPLVAAIVLPILAVLGGGAFAAQQGLIPGL